MAKKTAQPQEPEKKVSIDRIIAEINKKHGENVIGRLSEMKNINIQRISSGILSFDMATGGGLPIGAMVELYGVPSGGKSLISMMTIANAQRKGLECVYIDAEGSFDPEFAKKLGVDTEKLVIAQSSVGEDTLELVAKLLQSEPAIIVIDSVAAMVTMAEMEGTFEQQFMAPKARLMSRALAKLNALNKNTLIIFINQLRSTLVMYGTPTTTTGGRALGHYASIRVEVKKGDPIHEEDKKTAPVIGQVVSFNVVKNKTAPPFRLGSFKFFYDDCHME